MLVLFRDVNTLFERSNQASWIVWEVVVAAERLGTGHKNFHMLHNAARSV